MANDLARWHNDAAVSALTLVRAIHPTSTNAPAPLALTNQLRQTADVLAADGSRTLQAFTQFEFALLAAGRQAFADLLPTADLSPHDPGQHPASPPPSVSPPGIVNPFAGGAQPLSPASHAASTNPTTAAPSTMSPDVTSPPPVVSGLFNTGVDGSGNLLADGATDSHYQLIQSADPNYPGPSAVVVNHTTYPLNGWWAPDGPNSNWIGPRADYSLFPQDGSPPGGYIYETTFDLSGNVTGLQLNGQWTDDDQIVEVDLNGQPTSAALMGTGQYSSLHPFSITGNFVDGTNTLDFYVNNVAAQGGNGGASPTGLRVEWGIPTQAPQANPDSYSLVHDQVTTVSAADGVLANDADPNNLPLSAVLVSRPSHGSLTFNSDGSFIYAPAAGYVGSDSFQYYASNGQQNSPTATVSLTDLSTISGQVWMDSNQDGLENNSETGMSGVTVLLVTPDGSQVSSTTTDANGNYQLTVDPSLGSQFQIQVLIPDGDTATIPFASTSGTYSSIDYNGYSNVLTLPASGGISNVNAGIVSGSGPLGSISGEVWLDGNDNGVLESGEAGLQAINVNLLDANGDVLDSTRTDANGAYSFLGVSPNVPYTVQFVSPTGYVFSPQLVGPPSTSSSAGANGSTAPITLSPGQSNTTVNAGLYGSAPIVYQTDVYIMAENDSYTGMDLTADGYDPNGLSLTPVMVQAPTTGSLVYNTSTGLYDYTAPSGYVGYDNFQYKLSDGSAFTDIVTVHVLAYGQTLPPGTYDSFPLMAAGLYNGNGDQPDPSSVRQGGLNDCWFVSAAAGVAQQQPTNITKDIIHDNGNGTYVVSFYGHRAVSVGFSGDTDSYSTSNGDWLKVLEKGYGSMARLEQGVPFTKTAYRFIDADNSLNRGIEVLTGKRVTAPPLPLLKLDAIRSVLKTMVANKTVVTALVIGGDVAARARAKANGLVGGHAYTVVDYNSTTDKLRLYNPAGGNRFFNNGTDPQFWLGKNDPDNPNPATFPAGQGGNGYFWMSLSDFVQKFSEICYQQ